LLLLGLGLAKYTASGITEQITRLLLLRLLLLWLLRLLIAEYAKASSRLGS